MQISDTDTERTRRAFDAAAPVYDSAYEKLRGIRRIRSITSCLYLRFFPPGSRLLEINCGTGNDAVFLARHGMHVLATDFSERMLEETRKKIDAASLHQWIETRHLSFDQLGELRGSDFDGVYSNLGGLNCTDRLSALAKNLAAAVRPGGALIATVMSGFCLWETASYLSRLQWRQAFRRMSASGALASLHGGTVRTYYHSPRSFRAAFAPSFDHLLTRGLAVFTPPPNFTRAYAALGNAVGPLEKLEDLLAGIPPLSSCGDHYTMVLCRKER